MNCVESIRQEIEKSHPELKLKDECINGIIEILKKQCPHFNKKDCNPCECDPCECDPCK